MTVKEIIDGLKFTIDMFLFDPSTGETFTEPRNDMDKTTIDACKGAIELLEQTRWIPCSERLPRASEIVLLSLPEHTMVDGEGCFPCVICGHYIGGNSEEWGISDGTTVGYGLVAYKHCKPVAGMPLPEPYKTESEVK